MAPRSRTLLLALMTLSCASGSVGPATPAPSTSTGLAEGLRIAERWRAPGLDERRFDQETFLAAIRPALDGDALRVEEVARSIEGRPISAISFGEGTTTVLLWSQMHGDESTATMAIADILRFLDGAEDDPLRERLRRSLTVTFVPMLNPDGAERFRRENALGVDVNRDARRLATPEARALKGLRDRIRPDFGFNLHDQGARTVAGSGGEQVAIALLAPAADADRSYGEVRSRARLLAAGIAAQLATEIPGRVAKYDDTFNPRAFGDLMQQWGTSTVLIESGALPVDPQKQRLRALNVAAILSALDAIATRGWERADPDAYESLPFNARVAWDLLLRGGHLVLGDTSYPADVALTYDDAVARTGPRLRDVGDLDGSEALDTLDATGLYLHPAPSMLDSVDGHAALRLDVPAAIALRRGPEAAAPLARAIGDER